jgi:hypothetical protein
MTELERLEKNVVDAKADAAYAAAYAAADAYDAAYAADAAADAAYDAAYAAYTRWDETREALCNYLKEQDNE